MTVRYDRITPILVVLAVVTNLAECGFTFYLAPYGKDTNSGLSEDEPLRTLNVARMKTQVAPYRGNPITVEMMAGSYEPVTFTAEDKFFSPVTFRAYQNQNVHISGARYIPAKKFQKVSDEKILDRLQHHVRKMILEVNLWDAGVMDIGAIQQRGYYKQFDAGMELFFNGKPLILAAWPNEGYINVTSVPMGRFGRQAGFMETRADHWEGETDVWVHGYWYNGWADFSTKVVEYDRLNRVLTLDNPGAYGIRAAHEWMEGGYFYFFNVLSELDQPGEYYIDRENGMAYIFPPEGQMTNTDVVLASEAVDCIRLEGASNIIFKNIHVEFCRGNGVFGKNTYNVAFKNMQISNTGAGAIYLYGDNRYVKIKRSLIFGTTGGIYISGGNRDYLKPANNTIEDNFISDTSRLSYTGQPALMIEGVGTTVRNNEMANVGSFAFWWTGNNHMIENNRIHHACLDSSDCAAMGSGMDWTYRGNVIRRNYIFHNRKQHPGYNARGILLDNQYSGAIIKENVFYDNDEDIRIGGGRDNVIRNNIFAQSAGSSIVVDKRGLGQCGPENNQTLFEKLKSIPVNNEEWLLAYPDLVALLWDHEGPHVPKGNVISENIFTQMSPGIHTIDYCPPDTGHFVTQTRNLMEADFVKDFVNAAQGDLRPNRNSPHMAMWRDMHSFPEIPSPLEVGPRSHPGVIKADEPEPEPTPEPGSEAEYDDGMHEMDYDSHGGEVDEYPTDEYSMDEGAMSSQQSPEDVNNDNGATSEQLDEAESIMENPPAPAPNLLKKYLGKEGCYLTAKFCTAVSVLNEGWLRDEWGEMNRDSAISEENCFNRAKEVLKKNCDNDFAIVTAMFGPSARNMTVGGDGCYIDLNYCKTKNIYFSTYRDVYGEEKFGTGENEAECLNRAKDVWEACGSEPKSIVTATFRMTGATRTIGMGCWISIPKCPTGAKSTGTWYDGWGATNRNTDEDEQACARQASAYWWECGGKEEYPVEATYRPTGRSTLSGEGCWIESSYCHKHEGPTDFRDTWGEKKEDANIESGCLLRAKNVYAYCGSDPINSLTATYRPTGAFQTVEAGCFVTNKCRRLEKFSAEFTRDKYGEENAMTGFSEEACLSRAQEFHKWCKNSHEDQVTARFGPTGGTYTYP